MSSGPQLVNPSMDYLMARRAHETMIAAYLVVGVAGVSTRYIPYLSMLF